MTDDDNHVLVKGPNNRHILVHKSIQAHLPDNFPLVEEKPSANADGKTQKKELHNGN